MRTLVVGDIHGGLKALKQLLGGADLKSDDRLIFVGDYVDGWSEAAQVIDYLIDLSKQQDCIFIKGNHDIWCEDWLRTGEGFNVWLAHGGAETVESYKHFSDQEKKRHLIFFEEMLPYFIDNNRLFIHAGYTSMHGVEHETFKQNYYFDRTLWEMALAMKKGIGETSLFYPKRLKHYEEIYIGHTPTTNYNSFEPINAANIWNVDTGAAFMGKLTALDIDTKEFYQSDVVQSLYPNETGRNK